MLRDKRLIESELLVVRWQRGDAQAFGQVVGLWERSLFYYVRRLVGSEADAWEVLQEVWLKVFRAGNSVRDAGAFPAFLYRAARNAAVSRLRRRGVAVVELDGRELGDESAGEPVAEFENAEEVHRALDRLPVLQREVLTLFFLEELSLDEVAGVLGIPAGTVKSRLFHARRAMREILLQGDGHVRVGRTVSESTAGGATDVSGDVRGVPEGA